jgi:hypothetical protein
VWRIEDGQWVKDTIWGGPEAFGPVRLTPDAKARWLERAGQTIAAS